MGFSCGPVGLLEGKVGEIETHINKVSNNLTRWSILSDLGSLPFAVCGLVIGRTTVALHTFPFLVWVPLDERSVIRHVSLHITCARHFRCPNHASRVHHLSPSCLRTTSIVLGRRVNLYQRPSSCAKSGVPYGDCISLCFNMIIY